MIGYFLGFGLSYGAYKLYSDVSLYLGGPNGVQSLTAAQAGAYTGRGW